MDPDPRSAGDIRVGHRERDAVVLVLQEAAADGRLSIAELDERVEAALGAKTYTDLDVVVADLSVEPPSRAVSPGPRRPPAPGSAGYAPDDPLRLEGGTSHENRRGAWVVPPFVLVNQGLGSVKLDCTEAVPAAQLIQVEVTGGAGRIVIVLPEGWAVDADRLTKGWGSKSVRVPQEPAPGQPLLVLRGSLGLGSLTVRRPGRLQLRRLARRAARPQLGR